MNNDGEVIEFIEAGQGFGQQRGPKTDADDKLDAIKEALSADAEAFISVSRQKMGGNSPMEFVGRYPADKYDFGQLQAFLQAKFGGGDYRCMLYAKGKLMANKLLVIAEEIAAPANRSDNEILRALANGLQQVQQQVMQLAAGNNGGGSRKEWLEEMVMYKNLFDRPAATGGGVTEILQTVEGLKSLGFEVGPRGQEDAGFSDLIAKAAPLLQAALAQRQQNYQPVPQQSPAPRLQPGPQVQQQRQPVPTPQTREDEKMQFLIKMGLQTLVNAARAGSDPEAYAVVVLDSLEEAQIRQFFIDGKGIKSLILLNPEVSGHLPWFEDVAEHVKAMLDMPSKFSDLYNESSSASLIADGNETEGADSQSLSEPLDEDIKSE